MFLQVLRTQEEAASKTNWEQSKAFQSMFFAFKIIASVAIVVLCYAKSVTKWLKVKWAFQTLVWQHTGGTHLKESQREVSQRCHRDLPPASGMHWKTFCHNQFLIHHKQIKQYLWEFIEMNNKNKKNTSWSKPNEAFPSKLSLALLDYNLWRCGQLWISCLWDYFSWKHNYKCISIMIEYTQAY